MTVKVLTQPNCAPCTQVKRWLSNKGVEFEELDVTSDSDAFTLLKSLNYQQTPVIVAGDMHWSGINLEKMKELV